MQSLAALGTTVELRLVVRDVAHAERWFTRLWDEVRTFESRFSRFRVDSELTKFNFNAGNQVPLSPQFTRLLTVARDLAIRTDGLFNPFILPSLQKAGYHSSMTEPETDAPDFSTRHVVSIKELELGDTWARIPKNTALDLGGIGKGYLADQLADLLAQEGDMQGSCLSLGGDIRTQGLDESGQHWHIDIQSTKDHDQNVALFISSEEAPAVATSGLVREKGGVQQLHQIDTCNREEGEKPFAMCTVAGADATTADVLASSVLMGGETVALNMLEQGMLASALLQRTDQAPVLLGSGISLL